MNDPFQINQSEDDDLTYEMRLIQNREKLKIGHIPDRIQFREGTMQNVVNDAFKPALKGRQGEDVVITGKPGTGKTAVVRYIDQTIRENYDISNLRIIYVNCKNNNSKQEVFQAIMESLDLNYTRGLGVGENVTKLFEQYQTPDDESLVIILDEVDALYKDRREYINDVIYTLKRPHENSDLFDFRGDINLVCVSNDEKLFNYLEKDVRDSCFSPQTYEFLDYSRDEITEILMQRQDAAFAQQLVDRNQMRDIADVVKSQFEGDIRVGIRILRALPDHYMKANEEGRIENYDIVEEAIDEVKRSRIEQVLNGKDKQFLLVASALIQNLRNDKSKLKYIVDAYRRACEQASMERHGDDNNTNSSDSRAKSRSFVRRKLEYLVQEKILSKEKRYDKPHNPYFYKAEVDLDLFERMVNERMVCKGVTERFELNKERGIDKSTANLSDLDEDDKEAVENLQTMVADGEA